MMPGCIRERSRVEGSAGSPGAVHPRGGTAQAQAVFPRFGFEQRPKLAIIQKVLAPFHRWRTINQRLFRRWAGTVKDIVPAWLEGDLANL
jgi:hypothetical protein